MALRNSISLASATAVLLGPPAALVASLWMEGKPLLADGADNAALVVILMPSYLFTLLGFFILGLPFLVTLDKVGGDPMLASGIVLVTLFLLPIGLSGGGFFSGLATLTFAFTAAIFLLVYLAFGRRQTENRPECSDA